MLVRRLRVDEEGPSSEGVHDHVDPAGARDQGARDAKVGYAHLLPAGGGHAACCDRERENGVGQRIYDHVSRDAAEATEIFGLDATEARSCGDLAAEIKVEDRVEHDGAEFGEEDPEVVEPESFRFIVPAKPALDRTWSA